MTNEEKIQRYCSINFAPQGTIKRGAIRRHMLNIAKWKDKQFEEEKKVLLELVKMLPVNETNQTIIEDLLNLLR